MQQPILKRSAIVFWILALLDVTAIAANIELLQLITKPLLVPVLMFMLFNSNSAVPGRNLLMAGLFFSWIGDVLLMLDNKYPLFFIFGLACFLITHIFYIVYFLGTGPANASLLKKQPALTVLVAAYGILLVWLLYPYLGELKLPVMAYAAVICTMLLCSLHIYLKVNKQAAVLFLTGASAFVLSDTLLAINKFYQPFAFAGVYIMITYCAAQYFIVRGYTEQIKP